MASQLQLRRGTTVQHGPFIGAPGEITVDTDKKTTVVHDGSTAGGFPSLREGTAAGGVLDGTYPNPSLNIPGLTDATTVNAADELIVQQGGITKRATATELAKGLNAVNSIVNAKDYGAIPDWNGSSGTDNQAAFVAALNVLNAQGGGRLEITAPGSYMVGSSISVDISSDIEIVFSAGVTVVAAPAMASPVFYIVDNTAARTRSVIFRNPSIDCSLGTYTPAVASCTGITVKGLKMAVFENVHIYGGTIAANSNADSGITGSGNTTLIIRGGVIEGFADAGVYWNGENDASDDPTEGVCGHISNVLFYRCVNSITVKREFNSITVDACAFYQCDAGIIPAEVLSPLATKAGRRIIVSNNLFRQCKSNCVRIRPNTAATITGNAFEDTGIDYLGAALTANTASIIAQGARGAVISGNLFSVKRFSAVNNCRGISFSNVTISGVTYTYGDNLVSANSYDGLVHGITESSGGDANVFGNEFDNTTSGLFTADTTSPKFYFTDSGAFLRRDDVLLSFENTDDSQNWAIGSSGSPAFVLNDATNTTNPIIVQANAPTNSLRILATTGYCGLGAGTPESQLHVDGDVTLSNATTTTTATAGAETLPANPAGFLTVKINGTSRKIPYYAA